MKIKIITLFALTVLLLGQPSLADKRDVSVKKKEPIYVLHKSPYSYEVTKKNIYAAIKAMNFRAYKPRLLEQNLGILEKDVDSNKKVFRFCNFQMLDKILKVEPRVGIFLPCNITVLRTPDNTVYISVFNIKRISTMFHNPELMQYADKFDEIISELIEEAML